MTTRRLMLISTTFLASFSGLLAGCQEGRAFVLEPAAPDPRFAGVVVREGESTAPFTDDKRTHFERELRHRLAFAGMRDATPADAPLVIEYRQVLHDEGSSATRVGAAIVAVTGFPTGALGMGQLGVEATYKDASGNVLARIVADGPIDGPLGTPKTGLSTAARTIASYAKSHFAEPVAANAGILTPTTTHWYD